MNLFDMARRRDPNLVFAGTVDHAKFPVNGESWRGLRIAPGSSFRIPDVRRFVNFRSFPDQIGWMVRTPAGVRARVAFVEHGGQSVFGERYFEGGFQPLVLPWTKQPHRNLDLLFEAQGQGDAPAFLGNHRILDRGWLIAAAIGKGVEIGPGPNPQIMPGPGVDVSYLEQMQPLKWNELYNKSGKFPVRPELWDNYITGEASDLPVPDGSLDFIFASHVFEHLANPIGHLERWQRKLTSGGRIICIVPDLHGTKDSEQYPSTMTEWLGEREAGAWVPGRSHYERYYRDSLPAHRLQKQIDERASIHVHFYDNVNCQQLLELAVAELGYADFVIEHTYNHKDFYFILYNR